MTGRICGTFGGAFGRPSGRAQGVKTDLATDGTDDGFGRYAVEDRAQGGEAGTYDAEGGLDGAPEHDPVVVD